MSLLKPTEREQSMQREYEALCHAMQSGVKYDQECEPKSDDGTPKHLRVGVNCALNQIGALALYLEEKGLLDSEDYWEWQIKNMRAEVERYEEMLSRKMNAKIKLC